MQTSRDSFFPKLQSMEVRNDRKLFFQFEDGVSWEIQCIPKKPWTVLDKRFDPNYFKKAYINKTKSAVLWDDEVDLDIDAQYIKLSWKNPFASF